MPKQLIKLATILTLILLSTSLHAQIDSDKADKGVNINFFNGYAISYKWNTTQNLNYRVYLSLSSSWTDSEVEEESKNEGHASYKRDKIYNNQYLSTNLSFQFLFNLISQKSLQVYLGIGPNANYSYNKWDQTSNSDGNTSTSSYEYIISENSYGLGIISLAGIEAHLTDNITLFGETHLSGLRVWSESTRKDKSQHKYTSGGKSINSSEYISTGSAWKINLQLVKVGLGIYF